VSCAAYHTGKDRYIAANPGMAYAEFAPEISEARDLDHSMLERGLSGVGSCSWVRMAGSILDLAVPSELLIGCLG
jgi:hypothetical protein